MTNLIECGPRYADWSPTGFDHKGLGLPDQQDWIVCLGQNRDNEDDPLNASNWAQFIAGLEEALGGEDSSEHYEVCSFGHWACGWLEVILVNPDGRCAEAAAQMMASLADYPVLDESDWSAREWEQFTEDLEAYAVNDVERELNRTYNLYFDTDVHDIIEADVFEVCSADVSRYEEVDISTAASRVYDKLMERTDITITSEGDDDMYISLNSAVEV